MVGYDDDRTYVMMMKLVVNLVVLIHSSCFYTHTFITSSSAHLISHTFYYLSLFIFTFIFFSVSDMIIIWMIYYIYILYSRSIKWLGMMMTVGAS